MMSNVHGDIHTLLEEIERLESSNIDDDDIAHYIVVRQGGEGEVVVEANQAGMVHLASALMRLAASASKGQHYHLDETGVADRAEPVIVFSFEPGDWEAG